MTQNRQTTNYKDVVSFVFQGLIECVNFEPGMRGNTGMQGPQGTKGSTGEKGNRGMKG